MSVSERLEGLLESPPIERREAPRSPAQGLLVTVLGGALVPRTWFEVDEFGLNSLFLRGDTATLAVPGTRYRLRLCFLERTVEARAICVRIEDGARVGAVLRLEDDEVAAKTLLWEALQPSGIPHGHH